MNIDYVFPLEVISSDGQKHKLISEDIRIISHNYELYLYFIRHWKRAGMHLAKLHYNQSTGQYYIWKQAEYMRFEGQKDIHHEKNWISFEYCPSCRFQNGLLSIDDFERYTGQDPAAIMVSNIHEEAFLHQNQSHFSSRIQPHKSELYFVYRIQPHIITKVYQSPDSAEINTEIAFVTEAKRLQWPWGELRGGSPALPINDTHYLTFFHSSGKFNKFVFRTYVMGAYLFSR